jgi:alkyl hydroperoxide reductase subunit AhpC
LIDELLRVHCALIDIYQTAKVAPANWCPGKVFMKSAADSVSSGTKGWLQRAMCPIDKS